MGRSPLHPPSSDPFEDPVAHGRLFDFLGWLLFTRPGLSPAVADTYTSQVRAYLAVLGLHYKRSPLHVQAVLRLRQHHPDPGQPPRQPATKALIASIATDHNLPLCTRTAISVAFELLLRVSEYTCPTQSTINTVKCLRRRHVAWRSDYGAFEVHLPASKSDPFHLGHSLYIFDRTSDGDTTCAAALLRQYLASTPSAHPDDPLFVLPTGAFLTRDHISKALQLHAPRVGLPPALTKPHSLRIGGAFALLVSGAPWPVIKAFGRWLTDTAAQLYARIGDTTARRAAAAAFNTREDAHSMPLLATLTG